MLEDIISPLRRYSAQTIKYTLLMFNLVVVLSGITLLCLGIVIREVYTEYEPIVDHAYFSASTLLIVSGFLLFIFAFFGCCGAYRESHQMLMIYSTLIGLAFLIEIAAVITGYSLSTKPEGFLDNALHKTFNESTPIMELFWDNMETNLKCCGVNNYTDYKTIKNMTAPGLCCGIAKNATCLPDSYYPGCFSIVKDLIDRNATTIATGALSAILLQIVGMLCALWLAKSIANSYETF